MSKLQTMVELTEKHVPQDSTCVRGRNLTLGSARLYTLGVFLVVGIFYKEYSALGQCLFHLIQQVAKQGGIITFPIYGYRVLSLGKKKKKKKKKKSISSFSTWGQFYSQPSSGPGNSRWSPQRKEAGLAQSSVRGSHQCCCDPPGTRRATESPWGGTSLVATQ